MAMAINFAPVEDMEAHIADRVNAAKSWGGAVVGKMRFEAAITNARRQAAFEILRAIARNPTGAYWGALAEYVTVTNGELVKFDGEAGIPLIVPFDGATARKGLPADPDEIDAWREHPEMFTGVVDGTPVPHNEADDDGNMSRLACRYSLVNSVFSFTGLSATLPVIVVSEAMADEKLPLALAGTVTKLATPKLVKPGDAIFQMARVDAADGRDDLITIEQGALATKPPRPLTDFAFAQKQLI